MSAPRTRRESLSRLASLTIYREWFIYATSVLATAVATVWALRLWRADWTIPFYYGNDSILNLAGFKTIVETGWYEYQPLLGAPAGQSFHDWKIADNLGYLFAKFASIFTSDAAVILNLYFILGFLATAAAAVWFLRLVGVSRSMSSVLAVLYAIAPYHFVRGENHLFLAQYFPVPLAMGVVYLILRGQPIWGRNLSRSGWKAWATGRWVPTLLSLALVATANSYYAFFTVIFIAFGGLIALIRTRRIRPFIGAVAAGVVTVTVMLVNMLPDMVYSWTHGSNPEAVARIPLAIELYSLKFAQLVLPMQGHRIGVLSDIRQFYSNNFQPLGEDPVLGAVAAAGFVALLGIAIYLAVGLGRPRGAEKQSQRRLALGALAALTVIAFLLSTTGGLSSLLTYFTSDLRGWNRISIVLALFSLAAVGLIIDAAVAAVAARGPRLSRFRRVVAVALSAVVLLGGYLDQVSPQTTPNYALNKVTYQQDDRFVQGIESAVGADAAVVQLPYRDFPESPPVNGVVDTDQIKPYVHSSTLKWTGGGIKGRPTAEWVKTLETFPSADLTQAAAAAGFGGVLVDTQALGADSDTVTAGLEAVLGGPAVRSDDNRYVFYSLAPALSAAKARFTADEFEAIGREVVNPVLARLEPDVTNSYKGLDYLSAYSPHILLENPRDTPVTIDVTFTLATDTLPRVLRFSTPDGFTYDLTVVANGTPVAMRVVAPPGRSYIDVSVASGTPFPSRTVQTPSVITDDLTTTDIELEEQLGLRSSR